MRPGDSHGSSMSMLLDDPENGGREGGLLSPPSQGKNRWLFYRTRILSFPTCRSANSRFLRFMRKERHRSYGAEVVRRFDAEGFLRSSGSPCLHAPLNSCLKQGENTVHTGSRYWNPYSLSVPLTTFSLYKPLDKKGHLSLTEVNQNPVEEWSKDSRGGSLSAVCEQPLIQLYR
jgi:hypothetical protein